MPNGVPQRRFNDTKHICTCIDQTPIRNSRIHPFIDSKSWISGYNLIIIDPKHSREKKSKQHMDHASMTHFSATFSHSLYQTPNSTSCCYQPNFSPSIKPNITYRPHQFSLTSLLYIFFQFSSPYKSSYRARRDKVSCGVSGSIMFLL